jgi:cell division protein FtsI/penicillin-binding protein 2
LPATRAAITDRDGVPLAYDEQQQTVFATPYMLTDLASAAAKLAACLHVPRAPLQRALSDRASGFAYVARQVSPRLASKALALDIAGVGSYPEDKRVYPERTLATQLLGLVGSDGRGLAGIEYSQDGALSGQTGSETVVSDPAGQVLRIVHSTPALPGEDVRLTIDEAIQYETEHILAATVSRYDALGGTAIVEDPATGEIYAMANAPLVTTAAFADQPALATNSAVTDVYEPGSTFKVVTVAGCLADGDVTPDSSFVLPPTINVGGYTIHDAEVRPTERMTVSQILARSSNVGVVTLAERYLGKAGLLHWIHDFGFGRPTGVDFPGEAAGLLPGQWTGSTIGNVPFGQGVAVTPIQMASVYSAIADGGVWHEPRLIAAVGDRPLAAGRTRRIVSAGVDKELVSMLSDVVADGTGTEAQIPGYEVAGKTGTAQKVLPDGRGYSNSAFDASFVGFVPAQHPQLCVLVMIDQPDVIYGGSVAAPAFREIASFALQHLAIAP